MVFSSTIMSFLNFVFIVVFKSDISFSVIIFDLKCVALVPCFPIFLRIKKAICFALASLDNCFNPFLTFLLLSLFNNIFLLSLIFIENPLWIIHFTIGASGG